MNNTRPGSHNTVFHAKSGRRVESIVSLAKTVIFVIPILENGMELGPNKKGALIHQPASSANKTLQDLTELVTQIHSIITQILSARPTRV
ncbi:hypothetical protein BDM02DRAFT_3221730, partial [Thelephora ganbajun]